MPPSEPPTAACSFGDAERAQQRAVHGDHVADREQREVQPVALARSPGSSTPARSCPCSRRGCSRRSTWKRSVSTALPGPDQRVPPDRRLGVAGQRVADVDDRVRGIAVASRRRSPAARRARRTRASDPPARTSVSATRALGGDDAGVEAREVQAAVEARVLDLHAAVGDDVEARRRARSRPPRRCAGRAASRTRPRPRRPPRARLPGSWSARRKTSTMSGLPGRSASDG